MRSPPRGEQHSVSQPLFKALASTEFVDSRPPRLLQRSPSRRADPTLPFDPERETCPSRFPAGSACGGHGLRFGHGRLLR